jgi:4-amino-4-deoxy-L-arabinose transferase-like glycosyltransferase
LRDLSIRALTGFAAVAVLLTEALGAVGGLRPVPVAVAWVAVSAAAAAVWRWRRCELPRWPRLAAVEWSIAAACAGISGTIALTALLSPPNSADAMAYHLPRVVYWAQAGSVAFFPTPYFNQVMLAPAAEYLMLHTYLLTGGDRLVNLVACGAFAGCILAVSLIARQMGLGTRAQALAALISATLPNAILQASGAKNDLLLALWIVCAVYFGLRREGLWLGLAAGLAIATKATAFLFLPPLLLAAGVWRRRELAWIAGGVLLLNGPQFARNVRLSGSPLGYDSAQGNGYFRWRNERPGWRAMASNAVRNTSEQLGARSPGWNFAVYRAALAAHRALGLDPGDPATTWPGAAFAPPRNANHEANANNRWHLALFAAAAVWAMVRRDRRWVGYAAGLVAAFLIFCLYLKWQPFLARLEVPLFIAAAPLGAWLVDRWRPACFVLALALFLLSGARLPLLDNWTRPLTGPHSLWHSRRDDDYFRDMGQWNNRASYVDAVDRVARAGCRLVAIDISENQLEYPFQALLREREPGVRFFHAGVFGAPPPPGQPCAVLCPDCAGNERKLQFYGHVGSTNEIGRFLLFLKPGA